MNLLSPNILVLLGAAIVIVLVALSRGGEFRRAENAEITPQRIVLHTDRTPLEIVLAAEAARTRRQLFVFLAFLTFWLLVARNVWPDTTARAEEYVFQFSYAFLRALNDFIVFLLESAPI